MKNKYEIRGDHVVIFLNRRNSTAIETLIDIEDLPKAQKYNGAWYAHWCTNVNGFYVKGNAKTNDKKTTFTFHRYLTNAPVSLIVDHINHDTLDNRRDNLRIVTHAGNQQNQIKAQRNNKTSGVLGVTWNKINKKWRARIGFNGKQNYLGSFNTIEEAEQVYKKAKADYHPYSQEAIRITQYQEVAE